MVNVLAADTLLSVLAGLSLFVLRSALLHTRLERRLIATLRFGALVLGLFYVLRPLGWHAPGSGVERLILIVASLTALAILLVAEAAVQRHAHAWLKWFVMVAVPVLILAALVLPQAVAPVYLAVLLGFQIVVLLACSLMLWRHSGGYRLFAALILLCLPVIATESALLNDSGLIHASALAVLVGVWLLVNMAHWTARPVLLVLWGAVLLGLSGATALAVSTEHWLVVTAVIAAILVFASLLTSVYDRRSGGLERRLARLLERPVGDLTTAQLLEALSDKGIARVPDDLTVQLDFPAVHAALRDRPLWSAGQPRQSDADEALADVARVMQASHLLSLGTAPLRLVSLRLGSVDAGQRGLLMLTALSRRLESEETI